VKYTIWYRQEGSALRMPVEVEAEDEEQAIMRAGMKRSLLMDLNKRLFPNLARRRWERIEITKEKK
jgi:hypothetical protein